MNIRRMMIAAVTALFAVTAVRGQQGGVSETYRALSGERPAEKVYVHTDRDIYLAGETLWMKFYCVDAASHRPLDLSRVVYAEVLDGSARPVLQGMFALKGGTGQGDFRLPVTLGTGTYLLRAYTAWMKNDGADFFFEKEVRIANSVEEGSAAVAVGDGPAYDVQFFPEGGDLVEGLTSTVGFRAVDRYGKGIACRGAVLCGLDTVARFAPGKFGLGRFVFRPEPGRSYRAVVRLPEGGWKDVPFPRAKVAGQVMHLSESDGRVRVEVNSSAGRGDAFTLFVHDRQRAVYEESRSAENGKAVFDIGRDSLPAGITRFTLFDAQGRPLCERLYFKVPGTGDGAEVRMTADGVRYGLREPVELGLAAEPALLSLSVVREEDPEGTGSADIRAWLWLGSELGPVEASDYYLGNGEEVRSQAENLMLTHGWRRFRWEDAGSGLARKRTCLPEYEGHLVSGTVRGTDGRPVPGALVRLSVPGPRFRVSEAVSDRQGRLTFNVRELFGSGQLVAEAADSALRVEIHRPYFEGASRRPLRPFDPAARRTEEWKSRSVRMQAQRIFHAADLERFRPLPLPAQAFYFPSAHVYRLDEYTRFPLMKEVMLEFVSDVRFVQAGKEKYRLQVAPYEELANPNGHSAFSGTPLVLLDGVVITDHNRIYHYNPLNVKEVEIYRSVYALENSLYTGIVSFSSEKYDLPGFRLGDHTLAVEYEGLRPEREFFSPVYVTASEKGGRVPDFRSVLYWAPDLRTEGTDRPLSLKFYTSDLPGRYRAVVQGISADGRPAYAVLSFEVAR